MLLAIFICLLFAYSLVSGRLEKTVITAPILFTLAGMCVFPAMGPAAVKFHPADFLLLAEIGLVLLLFTDASRTDLKILGDIRALPARLLSVGMLFTILLGAIAAKLVFPQLSLWEAGILSAILAPTDAGLGQVIVNSPLVPQRVREALTVEAGLNDGLSVPFIPRSPVQPMPMLREKAAEKESTDRPCSSAIAASRRSAPSRFSINAKALENCMCVARCLLITSSNSGMT